MSRRLFFVKAVHSVVFWYMMACLVYILYAAIARDFGMLLLVAIGSILANGLALLLNRWRCPITTFAERLGAADGSVTGICLPDYVANNVFKISLWVFSFEVVVLAVRFFSGI